MRTFSSLAYGKRHCYVVPTKAEDSRKGGGGGSKPSLFGLFLLFVLWFVLVLNVWKKLVRLV